MEKEKKKIKEERIPVYEFWKYNKRINTAEHLISVVVGDKIWYLKKGYFCKIHLFTPEEIKNIFSNKPK